jgi:hypothetical protein
MFGGSQHFVSELNHFEYSLVSLTFFKSPLDVVSIEHYGLSIFFLNGLIKLFLDVFAKLTFFFGYDQIFITFSIIFPFIQVYWQDFLFFLPNYIIFV